MPKHIIDPNTIGVPANMRIAEGRTEKGYSKRIECVVCIDRDSLNSSHFFQVIVDHGIVDVSKHLGEIVKIYNTY